MQELTGTRRPGPNQAPRRAPGIRLRPARVRPPVGREPPGAPAVSPTPLEGSC